MNRDKLISILASLDTPSLLKALQANGIDVKMPQGGDDGGLLGGMGAGDEKVQGWGERKVSLKGSGEPRPSLLDKEWLTMPKGKDPGSPVDEFLGGEEADLSPYGLPIGEM